MIRTHAMSLVRTSLLVSPLLFAPLLHAQQPVPPPQGPNMQQHRGMQNHDEGRDEGRDRDRMDHGGSMGIVPPGTWWRRPEVIQKLALTADQQKRLDDILLQNRIKLVQLKATLEEEQLKLEPVLNANPPDATRALAQISHIADLRADLEKANAKMLLGLRGVLTADQWTKLHDHSDAGHGGGHGQGGGRGQRGPDGSGMMGGPGGNVGNPPMPPKNDD